MKSRGGSTVLSAAKDQRITLAWPASSGAYSLPDFRAR
jgi:hypothetical protein